MQAAEKRPVTDQPQVQHLLVPHGRDRAFWFGLVVMVASLVSGLATYLILTNLTPIAPRGIAVFVVLLINVVLILAMCAMIVWQGIGLWRAWRNKVAGSRLHVRIVALFSLIAALPSILLAIAATTSFARGIDNWFGSRPRQIIQNSVQVATDYLEEHGQIIRTEIVAMARDLDNAPLAVRTDPKRFHDLLIVQANLRDLAVAYVIAADGHAAVEGVKDDRFPFEQPSPAAIKQAFDGLVPVEVSARSASVWAVAKLQSFPGYLLYVARRVNPTVLKYLSDTQASLSEYQALRKARGPLTVLHGLMYFMTALTALLAAIWAGFWFAGRFVDPIGRIIAAAQEVSRGNLKVRLPVIRGEGDLRRLSQTFNTMTSELRSQRDELVTTNEQLTERRQFMEAVLSGVSAGVLGLDADGRIRIANSSAERLLSLGNDELVGRLLSEAVPAFGSMLDAQRDELKPRAQTEAKLAIKGEDRTFSVRVIRHGGAGAARPDQGCVVTFDDITELVSAQRSNAWGEVARRMAHEIKNPLTPIMLSAERIRRKYARVITVTEDRELFEKLTATIERQAGDIKTMVDEFASFARVPKPVMELSDLREALQEPMIQYRETHPALTYNLDIPKEPVLTSFDRRLISQAVTNLVKNATEAVMSAREAALKESAKDGGSQEFKGRVDARLVVLPDRFDIEVIDNGTGLPKQNRMKLLEPYVSTKGSKGTGLGLAIVQKIVEQHGGMLALEDAPLAPGREHGALVRLSLPIRTAGEAHEARPAAE